MFIVIELFPWPAIVTSETTGLPLQFETQVEAQAEADDCQIGIVVEIPDN